MDEKLALLDSTSVCRQSDRDRVATRLGIEGDFMRVPQISKALGVTPNAIYAQMRLGTFPIPHRRVGNLVVVKLDDYIAWLEAKDLPTEPTTPRRQSVNQVDDRDRAIVPGPLRTSAMLGETRRDRNARIKHEIRESMRRKGLLA